MTKIVDSMMEKVSPSRYDPIGLGKAYWDFWSGVEADAAASPEKGDRRFSNPAWNEKLMFDLIKQSYLLTSRHVMKTVGGAELEAHEQLKLDFYTKQYDGCLVTEQVRGGG